jgi:hypothetical protein
VACRHRRKEVWRVTESAGVVVFAGIDWATETHDVCQVKPAGVVVAERAFPADAGGLAALAN